LYDHVAVLALTPRNRRWPTLHWYRADAADVPTFYASHGLSPIPKTSMLVFQLHLRRALKRVIQKWGRPDLIHTEDGYGYYVIKAGQRLGIPSVMSQHWTGFMEQTLDPGAVRRFAWAFAHAVQVLPANKYAAKDYERYGLRVSFNWMPNALDTQVFRLSAQQTREPWLLHASGFTPVKRFPDVVKAFARVRHTRPAAVLQVVGDGVNRAAMEALAGRELPPGSFNFHGWLSKPELADLMRRSCGFVFPSEAETFGCVLMEAMACGCPVLTTRIGGISAVVHENEGLFVEVGDIEQIAVGMGRLLDGTHGLDQARISRETQERFSRANVGSLLHQEYIKALRGTAGDKVLFHSTYSDSIPKPA
jgi:glycosyltransferase involved in cell wall biosynthesis